MWPGCCFLFFVTVPSISSYRHLLELNHPGLCCLLLSLLEIRMFFLRLSLVLEYHFFFSFQFSEQNRFTGSTSLLLGYQYGSQQHHNEMFYMYYFQNIKWCSCHTVVVCACQLALFQYSSIDVPLLYLALALKNLRSLCITLLFPYLLYLSKKEHKSVSFFVYGNRLYCCCACLLQSTTANKHQLTLPLLMFFR